MRGGLDPIKAVKELSKTDLGVLTPNIRVASTSMTFGKSFEESMKAMAKSLHSELITRYTLLVVQASYSGGAVADTLSSRHPKTCGASSRSSGRKREICTSS